MTSSLVGSEMCIRDRPNPTYSSALSFAIATAALADSSEFCGSLLERSGAVSYTHLTLPTICSV
eukprot:8926279-Prorocentrum_lima.AAC.1